MSITKYDATIRSILHIILSRHDMHTFLLDRSSDTLLSRGDAPFSQFGFEMTDEETWLDKSETFSMENAHLIIADMTTFPRTIVSGNGQADDEWELVIDQENKQLFIDFFSGKASVEATVTWDEKERWWVLQEPPDQDGLFVFIANFNVIGTLTAEQEDPTRFLTARFSFYTFSLRSPLTSKWVYNPIMDHWMVDFPRHPSFSPFHTSLLDTLMWARGRRHASMTQFLQEAWVMPPVLSRSLFIEWATSVLSTLPYDDSGVRMTLIAEIYRNDRVAFKMVRQ